MHLIKRLLVCWSVYLFCHEVDILKPHWVEFFGCSLRGSLEKISVLKLSTWKLYLRTVLEQIVLLHWLSKILTQRFWFFTSNEYRSQIWFSVFLFSYNQYKTEEAMLTPIAKVVAPGHHGFIESRASAMCVSLDVGNPPTAQWLMPRNILNTATEENGVSGPSLCRCRHHHTLRVGC